MRRTTAALALLSGFLYVCSFPGVSVPGLIFLALVPLIIALHRAISLREAFLAGLIFGMAHIIGMTYWLYYAIHVHYGGSLLVTVLIIVFAAALPVGLHAGVFSLGFAYFRSGRIVFSALAVPALWVIVDYLRTISPVTLPWGLPAYAAINCTRFAQMADIAGVSGVTFVIVMVNACIAALIIRSMDMSGALHVREFARFCFAQSGWRHIVRMNWPIALIVVLAIIVPILYGTAMIARWSHSGTGGPDVGPAIAARIVQGNHGHKERWSDDTFHGRLDVYTAMSNASYRTGDRRIVVWPETILNSPARVTPALLEKLIGFMGPQTVLVAGGVRRAPKDALYNSVYVLSGSGHARWFDKNILLPFSETRPLSIGVLGRYYEAPDEFAPGTTPPIVRSDHAALGVSICFELIYPWFVRASVQKGADLLVNVSNDAWFGDSAEPRQHLDIARFRCIENRRYMLRASNSGISAVIGPTGAVLARSGLFTRESVDGAVRVIPARSIYTRAGETAIIGSLVVVLAMLVLSLFKKD